MEKAGIKISDNSKEYWLASRYVSEYSSNVDFRVRYVRTYGGDYNGHLCSVHDGGYSGCNGGTSSRAVRPVLTLESGILDRASGAGTASQPIEIY